jgi:hypothetical protein
LSFLPLLLLLLLWLLLLPIRLLCDSWGTCLGLVSRLKWRPLGRHLLLLLALSASSHLCLHTLLQLLLEAPNPPGRLQRRGRRLLPLLLQLGSAWCYTCCYKSRDCCLLDCRLHIWAQPRFQGCFSCCAFVLAHLVCHLEAAFYVGGLCTKQNTTAQHSMVSTVHTDGHQATTPTHPVLKSVTDGLC